MGYMPGVDYDHEPVDAGFDHFAARCAVRKLATKLVDLAVNGQDVANILAGGIETAFRVSYGKLNAVKIAKELVKVSEDFQQADLGDGWEPVTLDLVGKVKALAEEALGVLDYWEQQGMVVQDEAGQDVVILHTQPLLLEWHARVMSTAPEEIEEDGEEAETEEKEEEEEAPLDPIARMLAMGFKKGR